MNNADSPITKITTILAQSKGAPSGALNGTLELVSLTKKGEGPSGYWDAKWAEKA